MPKQIRPRDLMAFGMHRANLARQKLNANRGKPNEKELQLAYRDAVVNLHMTVCDYFGDTEFQNKEYKDGN